MKILLAVVVYKRIENIRTWLKCWAVCDQTDTELVVIHNHDLKEHTVAFKNLCGQYGVRYIPRANVGFDIGAFQDACKGKFGKFDQLIWCTDDTIPMRKDFVSQLRLTEPGLKCMEISSIRSPLHVRTTGFSISSNIAVKLIFPPKITTKEHCYQFEHRGGENILMRQVERMGYKCIQISEPDESPLWDMGNRNRLNRQVEHDREFASTDTEKVIFICLAYNNYPQIISSLICQTYENWELYIIHDGPGKLTIPKDPRIHFEVTKERSGNYGHSVRSEYLQKLRDKGDYVVITNADNYYMPEFISRAITTFRNNPVAKGVYCAQIVHNYTAWNVMNCRLERGYIDCGQVVIKSKEAAEVGWRSEHHSADWFFFADIIKKYGVRSFVSFPGVHFVHN